ncbi:MAG: ubiquitin-like protein UBact [Chthonomonadales bacterium]|nr:ubiquitin-like protein UBact [Chthonomonadales bacterium]
MIIHIEDRLRRPAPTGPERKPDTGPSKPDVQRPTSDELLRRMKKVDPESARRYRQRSGQ